MAVIVTQWKSPNLMIKRGLIPASNSTVIFFYPVINVFEQVSRLQLCIFKNGPLAVQLWTKQD